MSQQLFKFTDNFSEVTAGPIMAQPVAIIIMRINFIALAATTIKI